MNDINLLIKEYDSDVLLNKIIDGDLEIDLENIILQEKTIKRLFTEKNVKLLTELIDTFDISKFNYKCILSIIEKISQFNEITKIILFNLANKYKYNHFNYLYYHRKAYYEYGHLDSAYSLFKYYQKTDIKNEILEEMQNNFFHDKNKYFYLLEKIVENLNSKYIDNKIYPLCEKYIESTNDPSLIICYKTIEYLLQNDLLEDSFTILFEICLKFGSQFDEFNLSRCLEFLIINKNFPFVTSLYIKYYDIKDLNTSLSNDLCYLLIEKKIIPDDKYVIKKMTKFPIEDNNFKKAICQKILNFNVSNDKKNLLFLKNYLYLMHIGFQCEEVINKINNFFEDSTCNLNIHYNFITDFDLLVYSLNKNKLKLTNVALNEKLFTSIINDCPICLDNQESVELGCCNGNLCKKCIINSISEKTVCPFCNQLIKLKNKQEFNINFTVDYETFMITPLSIQCII